jgi:hypothetical protein
VADQDADHHRLEGDRIAPMIIVTSVDARVA